jgi:cytidine deaminase
LCDIEKGLQRSFTLEELLPHAFGPENLRSRT